MDEIEILRQARAFYEQHRLTDLIDEIFQRKDVKGFIEQWYEVSKKFDNTLIETLSSERQERASELKTDYSLESFTDSFRKSFEASVFVQVQPITNDVKTAFDLMSFFAGFALSGFSTCSNNKNILDFIKDALAIFTFTSMGEAFTFGYGDLFLEEKTRNAPDDESTGVDFMGVTCEYDKNPDFPGYGDGTSYFS